MLSDGRGRVVMTPATGDVIVDFLVRDEALSEPIEPVAEVALTPIEPPIEVLPPPVVVPCEIPALGGPSGTMYQPTVRGLDMTFVGLSDGQFCRGSPKGVADDNVEDDETPQHPVKISGFLLGMSEVTQAQWRVVVEAAKLAKDVDALSLNADPSAFKGDKLPVENVGWCDVLRFANVLSRLDGRAPAYEITVIPETTAEERYLGHCMVRWTANANGYRLPTEAEWEYAARAGTTTAFATGDDEAALTRAGWYGAWTDGAGGNSGGEPHDVCTRPEKPWGLCDLHGNVWEWVFNGNEVYVQHVSDVTVDPGHPSSDASSGFVETSSFTQPRGVRGGSWVEGPVYARSAYRNSAWADRANGFIGFRLVLPSSKRP